MDLRHLVTHQHVTGLVGDPTLTAFSALPGAPVQPDRPRRWSLRSVWSAPRRRALLVHLPRLDECTPVDAAGSRMAA